MRRIPAYRHPRPLVRGLVLARPNRFLFIADIPGEEGPVEAHCPVTINISNIAFTQPMPALFSYHPERQGKGARTAWTCQAISLDPPSRKHPRWVGINQAASNGMVDHFLRAGAFDGLLGHPVSELRREVTHAGSRFDFLLDGDHYLEVKTPLNLLPQDAPGVAYGAHRRLSDTTRFYKHLSDLTDGLASTETATILEVFQYPAPPFREPADSSRNEEIRDLVLRALDCGHVAFWQLDLEFREDAVRLASVADLAPFMRTWV